MKQKTIEFGPKKDWLKAAKTFARQAYGTARCKDIERERHINKEPDFWED